ncbi:proteinase B [Entomophthora muscae]|uniref:Proteinase B n=1 Tax=Entomophthora muscae TaxID=34485 RepID=A0ACC2RWA4_9FUNG|nr:proteinase B [Entomophthora muscae]
MKSFIEISLISVLFQVGYAALGQNDNLGPVQVGYIITLKSSTKGNVLQDHLKEVQKLIGSKQHSSEKNVIEHEYSKVLLGYSAKFTEDVVVKVKAMAEVEAVEEDQLGALAAKQKDAPWGLACLS